LSSKIFTTHVNVELHAVSSMKILYERLLLKVRKLIKNNRDEQFKVNTGKACIKTSSLLMYRINMVQLFVVPRSHG